MGCGLVSWWSSVLPQEAKKAIESLNDSKLDGREIKLKVKPVIYTVHLVECRVLARLSEVNLLTIVSLVSYQIHQRFFHI